MITWFLGLRDRSAKATLKYFGHTRGQFIWTITSISYWLALTYLMGMSFTAIFYWIDVMVLLSPMALDYNRKKKDDHHD